MTNQGNPVLDSQKLIEENLAISPNGHFDVVFLAGIMPDYMDEDRVKP
jgi:hypothetical protein